MEKIFICLILWLVMGSINAYYASTRGRDPIAWFMLGIPLGLLGPLILFFLPKVKESELVNEPHFSDIFDAEAINKDWYYIDEQHQQRGPFSFKDLQFHFFQKKFSINSFIWSEGMDEWTRLEELPQLNHSIHNL